MDRNEKNVLINSINYLQSNLPVTTDLLRLLQSRGVLNFNEIETIEEANFLSEKVLELVYCLKSKDKRIYSRFLNVLAEYSLDQIVDVLNDDKRPQALDVDMRTVSIIQQMLGETPANKQFASSLSSYVVLKSVHEDSIVKLQEEIEKLKQCVPFTDKGRLIERPSSGRSMHLEGETCPKQVDASQNRCDSSQNPQLMIGYQEEIKSLNKMLEKAYADVDAARDESDVHLNYVKHLTSEKLKSDKHSKQKEQSGLSNERLEDLHQTNTELVDQISEMKKQVDKKDSSLNEKVAQLDRIKSALGIPKDCPDTDIEQTLIKHAKDKKKIAEFDKQKSAMKKALEEKKQVINELSLLRSKIITLNFQIRQNQNTIKRISRGQEVAALVPQEFRDPPMSTTIDMGNFEYISKGPMADIKFCIVCKSEFVSSMPTTCSTHSKPLRRGLWSCCNNPSYKSAAGCRLVPHLYIDQSPEQTLRITDGVRQIDLT